MTSHYARLLNAILKHTLKPLLNYYSKQYQRTQDIRIIHRLRKLSNLIPLSLPTNAISKQLTLNGILTIQVTTTSSNPRATILYLHGGAYVLGSSKIYLDFAYRLAVACSAKILLIDYSLSPEKQFPAALNDVLAVYAAVSSSSREHFPVFIAGDSAGGGLALSTLIALRDKQLPLPTAAIALSPWADLALTGKSLEFNKQTESILPTSFYQLYAAEKDTCNPLASPFYADFSGLPPLLIQASSSEALFDDAKRVAEKAKSAGVLVEFEIWKNVPHGWQLFSKFLPEGKEAIEKIGLFVKKHVNASAMPKTFFEEKNC